MAEGKNTNPVDVFMDLSMRIGARVVVVVYTDDLDAVVVRRHRSEDGSEFTVEPYEDEDRPAAIDEREG